MVSARHARVCDCFFLERFRLNLLAYPFVFQARRALAGHGITDQFVYIDQVKAAIDFTRARSLVQEKRLI